MPYSGSPPPPLSSDRLLTNTLPKKRFLCLAMLGVIAIHASLVRAEATTGTQIVQATYRIGGGNSNATCWIVSGSHPEEEGQRKLRLVTAAHVLEKMDGNEATLVARSTNDEGEFVRAPKTIAIRKNDKPLWTKHAEHDVAVLTIEPFPDMQSVPIEALAAEADWNEQSPQPGDLVRCVGFPHAAHFDPSPAAFPLVRLGCLASYPLQLRQATFLVDFNTFEGDSGGPILIEANSIGDKAVKIVGLVSAQHFLDEKYETIYVKGHIRKRLGLAIVVRSQIILDTIRLGTNEVEATE